MSRAKFAAVVFSVFAVSAALVPLVRPVAAQEAAAAKGAGQPKARGRVPMYYGQIDLTSNQKTQIYAIQDQYDGRIDDLLTQIEELRVQRDSEIESVLSAGQRAELKKLLDEAKVERVQKQKELESAKKAIEAAKKKK